MPPKITKKRYQKLDPVSHILARPDMYVGSNRLRDIQEYVADKTENGYQIVNDTIKTSPAILRIFIEVLSNAIDNVERSRKTKTPCTQIKISLNQQTGETSVWNDGDVVPIEIDEDEGCYNHSMIFGQLLTGSNYDDEEERIVAGRNGLGVKLCLKKGTLIPKFNGVISKIEDIKVGDQLIGDDGYQRNVKEICHGTGKLFEVSQSTGKTYIVNENHILTLKMPTHKIIFWDSKNNSWVMFWMDSSERKINTKTIKCDLVSNGSGKKIWKKIFRYSRNTRKNSKFPLTRETADVSKRQYVKNAHEEMYEFAKTISDENIIDISIKEYMKLPLTIKQKLHGFCGDYVKWVEKDLVIDPYILGLCLGEGYQSGYGFIMNSSDDPEILDYLEKWGCQNDVVFRQNYTKEWYNYGVSCTKKLGITALANLLHYYDIVNCKHIPRVYIVNSRNTRLKILAGLIDSDRTTSNDNNCCSNRRQIKIIEVNDNSRLSNDITFLAKSLGFVCSVVTRKTQCKYKGEMRRVNSVLITISGNNLEDIPVLTKRKKYNSCLRYDTGNNGNITIKEVESGDYVGLEVDGNHRFVLEDFTVTHNCNVFSKKFEVEGCDPKNKKILKQTWSNNMRETSGSNVKSTVLKKGYTLISWIPDFSHFGMNEYTNDIIRLYTRHIIDSAMLSKVNVYLNGEKISVHSLRDYAGLYGSVSNENLFIKTKEAEIFLTPSREYQTISFVNGIYTRLGGQHVESWSEAFFRPIVDKFNGKEKKIKTKTPKINISDVRQFFRLFVVASVIRPEFNGQDKCKLESPLVNAEVKRSHITSISKWSVMDNIEEIIRVKEMVVLKKAEKVTKGAKIDGYDRANKSGGKDSVHCALFITEGLSAKTYVVAGIDEGIYGRTGRDWNGILPVRGKLLNVRDKTATTISGNKVICSLIQALGLKHGVNYNEDENYKKLNYGRLVIVADADVDGIHIEGLILNFIHALYPSLLQRKEPCIVSLKTPIARVKRPRFADSLFYDERNFQNWLGKQTKKVDIKYYKGLGTTKPEDVPDTFGKKLVEFQNDDDAFMNMQKAFHKKYSDSRKEWLGEYNIEKQTFSLDNSDPISMMTITDFINCELIKFSHADCARSIPNSIDGLKESQRKILYAVKKRKLRYSGKSLKVAQLAGYTAEHSNYHHGEKNLFETIIGMANEFPGTNNIPLLYRDGMFGCLDPDTPVLLWNGNIEQAKNIKVGDQLIGDDGFPRKVSKMINGKDIMYTVKQTYGESYKVNSCHILTLRYIMHKKIKETNSFFVMTYYDDIHKIPCSKKVYIDECKTRNEAYEEITTFADSVKDLNIFDIGIRDYLSYSETEQRYFKSVKNTKVVKWDTQEVEIDPYILGTWLGNRQDKYMSVSSINKLEKDILNKDSLEKTNFKFDIKLLKKHKLYKNNSIPIEYIVNDEKTRLSLIAGFIDAYAIIRETIDEVQYIEIGFEKYTHDRLVKSLQYLSRSLGFRAEVYECNHGKSGKYSEMLSLYIYGDLYKIPTRVFKIYKVENMNNTHSCNFSVTKEGYGEFIGWHIDQNERFLLGDFTVTHNTRLEGADDAADGRYIFTKMDALTELIFRTEDEPLLIPVNDDGDLVQPVHYVPIIPMFLINGCFHPYTQIPLWNGLVKYAKNIRVGDQLIGDDGLIRNVLNLCSGVDEMYEIHQEKGEKYIVNSKHTLCLKMKGDRDIFWINNRQAWKVEWFDKSIKTKFVSSKNINKEMSYKKMSDFVNSLPENDGIIEITVSDYIKLPDYVKARMKGVRSSSIVEWEQKSIELDPYILGVWLCDTDLEGRGITNTELTKFYDFWNTENKDETLKENCFGEQSKVSVIKDKSRKSLRECLKTYNLVQNKHIPRDYIQNSKKVRFCILAGIIDAIGNVLHNGEQIKILQSSCNESIIKGVLEISRSLGLHCDITTDKNNISRDSRDSGDDFYTETNLVISGNGIENIPTRIKNKRCFPSFEPRTESMLSRILVKQIGKGDYYGWEVDFNNRFVLNDYTITHNCIAGIGTGWSSSMPCYNPKDMIEAIRIWLDNDGEVLIEDPENPTNTISMFPDFTPWYRGFKGDIEKDTSTRYITYGIVEEGSKNTVEVTELPIRMWTSKFADFCDDLKIQKQLKSVDNYSNPKEVRFILKEGENFHCDLETLKLHSYVYTSNMVSFNQNEQLSKHNSVDEILDQFCRVRYEYYQKRKRYQIQALEDELRFLYNKERFVSQVIKQELIIMNEKESNIVAELEKRGYDMKKEQNLKRNLNDDENEDSGTEQPETDENDQGYSYNYLLKMQVRTFTKDKVRKLNNDIISLRKKLDGILATSESNMWLQELVELEEAYDKWLIDIDKQVIKPKKKRDNKKS